MTRIVQAELFRFVRRRTVLAGIAAAGIFAVIASLAVFSTARERGFRSRRAATTLASLNGTGGGTEAFAVGASFVGFLVFVTVIALIAGEFSGGTFRALLLREPRRLRVIVGKLAAILILAAGIVALAEVFTFGLSLVVAPSKDIPTTDWFSLSSLGERPLPESVIAFSKL